MGNNGDGVIGVVVCATIKDEDGVTGLTVCATIRDLYLYFQVLVCFHYMFCH